MKKLIAVLVLTSSLSAVLWSCSKSKTGCTYTDYEVAVSDSEIAHVQAYLTAQNLQAGKDPRGFYFITDIPGSGAKPTVCSKVSVTYSGKLTNGFVFDHADTPVSLELGQLIPGWIKGLPLIGAGGKIRLILPPSLGYGSRVVTDVNGNPVIPANSILDFEINLVTVGN
jgi:FKBP-type peptidyl-prolyl cis-trans isomerase FkpA